MNEMDTLHRRMEDMKLQYAQDKEAYRVQLVSTLLAAKKSQGQERQQQQENFYNYEQNDNLRRLREQQEMLQKQIDQELQQQRQRSQGPGQGYQAQEQRMFSPPVISSQQQQPVLQPVPRIAYVNPGTNQMLAMPPQPQYVNVAGRVMAVSCTSGTVFMPMNVLPISMRLFQVNTFSL